MAILVSYAHSVAPSLNELQKRMTSLIQAYPILTASTSRSTPPLWLPVEAPRPIAELVRAGQYEAQSSEEEEARMNRLCRAAHDELYTTGDVYTGDTWRVVRLEPDGVNDRVYIVISASHVLMDGSGFLRFAQLVLDVTADPDTLHHEALEGLERPEDLLDMLPAPGSAYSGPPHKTPPYWGVVGTGDGSSTFDRSVGFTFASLDSMTVDRLNAQAKAHGIRTLGPVLAATFLLALHAVTD